MAAKQVAENSPEFIARYNQLKALVAEHFSMGKIPNEMIVNPLTRQFLEDSKLHPVSAVEQYMKKKEVPPLVYYGYELSVNHRNKFLCLTEYQGQVFFGVKSPTKKEARTACAMRCLDYLVGTDLVPTLMEKKGKQQPTTPKKKEESGMPGLPKKTKKKNQKAVHQMDFSADMEMDKTAFETANVIDGAQPVEQATKYANAREELWELYSTGALNQARELTPETIAVLQSTKANATQMLMQYCQRQKLPPPEYHIFVLPVTSLAKFISCVDFNEMAVFGIPQPSKNQAKAMASAYVIDYLIANGQWVASKQASNKRPAERMTSEGYEASKKLKISTRDTSDNSELFNAKNENLDPKTVFYLVMNPKEHVVLLNEFCQKSKLPTPVYSMTQLASTEKFRYIATCEIPSKFQQTGPPSPCKKSAKASSARLIIDSLVKEGSIKVPNAGVQPLPSTNFDAKSPIFEFFKKSVYDAFEEAFKQNPILGWSNYKIAGCILVDSLAQTGCLVSWATGSMINSKVSGQGELLNDCYAEVLCRRGLLRYLYHEIIVYAKKPENSIFVLGPTGKLTLRPNFSFHFFLSHAPNGDAVNHRDAKPDRNHVTDYQKTASADQNGGSLSIKTDASGSTTSLLQISSYATHAVRLSMSSSDKILKWNALGLQGALVGIFVDPIYAMSYTIENDYDAKSLSRALIGRISNLEMPKSFKVNKPYIASVDPHQRIKVDENTKEQDMTLSVNWNAADGELEIVNCNSGKRANGGASRLSRQKLFEKFKDTAKAVEQSAWLAAKYVEAKQESSDYQEAASFFKSYLFETGLGQWVDKSELDLQSAL